MWPGGEVSPTAQIPPHRWSRRPGRPSNFIGSVPEPRTDEPGHPRLGAMPAPALTEWLWSKGERANPRTAHDDRYPGQQAWSLGNHVRPLVHGATYFAKRHERIEETRWGHLKPSELSRPVSRHGRGIHVTFLADGITEQLRVGLSRSTKCGTGAHDHFARPQSGHKRLRPIRQSQIDLCDGWRVTKINFPGPPRALSMENHGPLRVRKGYP
jgi:hypothetical protein